MTNPLCTGSTMSGELKMGSCVRGLRLSGWGRELDVGAWTSREVVRVAVVSCDGEKEEGRYIGRGIVAVGYKMARRDAMPCSVLPVSSSGGKQARLREHAIAPVRAWALAKLAGATDPKAGTVATHWPHRLPTVYIPRLMLRLGLTAPPCVRSGLISSHPSCNHVECTLTPA